MLFHSLFAAVCVAVPVAQAGLLPKQFVAGRHEAESAGKADSPESQIDQALSLFDTVCESSTNESCVQDFAYGFQCVKTEACGIKATALENCLESEDADCDDAQSAYDFCHTST
ncbi:uncharacterized protein J3D65DRAFT_671088 [Phyllosticta citribraziliensis]|uniref:Uncharacterized protein n=1 Tax=Phyllosticta citribraziliensis TaxID=989973 RepID=A0ABR1LFN0_9PEZI